MANSEKRIRRNFHFDYYKNKKYYFALSITLIAITIICSFIFGVKMDISFKGGTIVTYTYSGTMKDSDIKTTVKKAISEDFSINMKKGINGLNSFEVVLSQQKGLTADKVSTLTTDLKTAYSKNDLKLLSNQSVNPTLGKEFFEKSMLAVVFAAILIILYVAIRFKLIGGFAAGVMAIIALLHDLVIVFGVFVLFHMPLDANFIAVLLTILGYSVNDTIVIYDRIRENQKLFGKTVPRVQLVNDSVNETLTRSLNTSITTVMSMIIVSIVAMCMNVTSILSFSFPMIIGLISGSYSSICLAGPLWTMWEEHKDKKAKQAGKKRSK